MADSDITELVDAIFAHAMTYPGTSEDIACAGTAIEARTVKVGKRAFVFLRAEDMRCKVNASLEQVAALAAENPAQYNAAAPSAKGDSWIKVIFKEGARPRLECAKRWVDESYRSMATKTLLKQLDAA